MRYLTSFIILMISGLLIGCSSDTTGSNNEINDITNPADQPYFVEINPADFKTTNIDGNNYFPLIAGRTLVFEGENEEGIHVDIEETV